MQQQQDLQYLGHNMGMCNGCELKIC